VIFMQSVAVMCKHIPISKLILLLSQTIYYLAISNSL
jgi:hypothetical protein